MSRSLSLVPFHPLFDFSSRFFLLLLFRRGDFSRKRIFIFFFLLRSSIHRYGTAKSIMRIKEEANKKTAVNNEGEEKIICIYVYNQVVIA